MTIKRVLLSQLRIAALATFLHAVILAAVPALADDTSEWGDLVGQFVYDGVPPARPKLLVDRDLDFHGKLDIRDESLMVGENGGLANVFVYVRSRNVAVFPELDASVAERVVLEVRDGVFVPHCTAIWHTKQTLEIVNSDPVRQYVDFAPLLDEVVFSNIPVGKKISHTFNRGQRVPVLVGSVCHHIWKRAYIFPSDTPYVSISGMDGAFRISNLPVGELEFQVWHERVGGLEIPDWPKGRFKIDIKPGTNDIGTVKLNPTIFTERGLR